MKDENKLVYEEPKAELLTFDARDILNTSGESLNPFAGDEDTDF